MIQNISSIRESPQNCWRDEISGIVQLPPPVHVVIDRIEPKEQPDRAIVPVVRGDNRLEFAAPAPEGRVWLRGRVIWPAVLMTAARER